MSRAHAACVCMPHTAGPPCSKGGFCSPAMMDGCIRPFRPAMLQQQYLHNTGLPPVTSDTAWPNLGPPPTAASLGPSDTARTQSMCSLKLGVGGPHCCRDALSAHSAVSAPGTSEYCLTGQSTTHPPHGPSCPQTCLVSGDGGEGRGARDSRSCLSMAGTSQ